MDAFSGANQYCLIFSLVEKTIRCSVLVIAIEKLAANKKTFPEKYIPFRLHEKLSVPAKYNDCFHISHYYYDYRTSNERFMYQH